MLKHFQSCFLLGLSLAARDSGPLGPPPETVAAWRRELKKQLDLAERRVMSQWGPEAALNARRMVTVWLDELLLSSEWPGQKIWLGQPLQRDWAEGRSGGQWFFEKLENLAPERRDNRELALLALRCLNLGLTGRYSRSPGRLAEVRRQTIARFGLTTANPVFPPPSPPRRDRKVRLGRSCRCWLLCLAAGLLIFWLAGDLNLSGHLARIHRETNVTSPAAHFLTGDLRGELSTEEE